MESTGGKRPNGWVAEILLALEVPRWALRFYLRHLGVVVGISLIPSAQRAISQLWGEQLPGYLGPVGELVTMAARVVLFVIVLRLAFGSEEEERLRGLSGRQAWQRVRRFAREHWRSLVIQLGLIALMAIVFDRIPDAVIAPRIAEAVRPFYWAALLAVKNPTIIAFTLIWEVGILRQMLLHGPGQGSETALAAPVDLGAPHQTSL